MNLLTTEEVDITDMMAEYIGYVTVVTIAVLGIGWMVFDYYRETNKGKKK